MVTINISESTKDRFKLLKISESAKTGESISEDQFEVMLLNKFEGVENG